MTRRGFLMQIQTHRRLGILKADTEGWHDAVRHHIEEGQNFVLVLPDNPEAVEDFCHLFGLPSDCNPKTLKRADFFRLSQFIESEPFDEILSNWGRSTQVVFVEQLDFPINRPPRMKPFLVYSHVLGILAQGNTMADAKEALHEYEGSWGPGFPEASIYCWQKGRWQLYEGR